MKEKFDYFYFTEPQRDDVGYISESEIDDSDQDPDYHNPDSESSTSSKSSENESLGTLRKRMLKKREQSKFPPKKDENPTCHKRGRKVVKGDTREARKRRKICRNTGKEYSTLKGRVIRARKPKQIADCRKGCVNRISEEIRRELFNEYWSIDKYDKRVAYTATLILRKEKKTEKTNPKKARSCTYKFHLRVNGVLVEVCKGCFKNIYDLSNKYIDGVIKKSNFF